jgi:hypothetical protein
MRCQPNGGECSLACESYIFVTEQKRLVVGHWFKKEIFVVKRDALLLLRTIYEQVFKNSYKNQLLVMFFSGCEIIRVIAAELHNVTGRVLGQLCKF